MMRNSIRTVEALISICGPVVTGHASFVVAAPFSARSARRACFATRLPPVIAVTLSVLGIWRGVGSTRPLVPPPVVPGAEEPARVQASDYLGAGVLGDNQKLSYDLG